MSRFRASALCTKHKALFLVRDSISDLISGSHSYRSFTPIAAENVSGSCDGDVRNAVVHHMGGLRILCDLLGALGGVSSLPSMVDSSVPTGLSIGTSV